MDQQKVTGVQPRAEELQGIGTDPQTSWGTGLPSVVWTTPGTPFVNVQPHDYWSNDYWPITVTIIGAWAVSMDDGYSELDVTIDDNFHYVWPVRDAN